LIIFWVLFFRRVRKRSKENSGRKAKSNRKTNSLISKTCWLIQKKFQRAMHEEKDITMDKPAPWTMHKYADRQTEKQQRFTSSHDQAFYFVQCLSLYNNWKKMQDACLQPVSKLELELEKCRIKKNHPKPSRTTHVFVRWSENNNDFTGTTNTESFTVKIGLNLHMGCYILSVVRHSAWGLVWSP
jgi:hypothetical protein